MVLTGRIGHHVADQVKSKGRNYWLAGAVKNLGGGAWQASAQVQGNSLYTVDLERKRDTLKVCCDCPYYADTSQTCKHIWATLLAAEAAGYLKGATGDALSKIIAVVEADPSLTEDDLDFEGADKL